MLHSFTLQYFTFSGELLKGGKGWARFLKTPVSGNVSGTKRPGINPVKSFIFQVKMAAVSPLLNPAILGSIRLVLDV